MQRRPNLKQVSRTAAVAPYQRPPLTNACLGDKTAAFKLVERAMATVLIEKDAMVGAALLETLARVAAQTGEPGRAIAALQKLLSISIRASKKLCQEKPKTADK
jgi:hypothetical protein